MMVNVMINMHFLLPITLLAQKDDNGHEYAIYYLSRTLIGAASRYNPIEKEWLALGWPDHTCHF